jgi:hypothetical protein
VEDLALDRGHRTLRIVGKGNKPAAIPLLPRTGRTLIWQSVIGAKVRFCVEKVVSALDFARCTLTCCDPHSSWRPWTLESRSVTFRSSLVTARFPIDWTQPWAVRGHADPRTTTIYDRRRENFDRHAAFMAGG